MKRAARDPGEAENTAVIYLRVSTKDQATRGGEEEGFSIPAQREACTQRAALLGVVVAAEFVDAGESARSTKRPQLQAMLRYIEEHATTFVVIHKLDRLARNLGDSVTIWAALDEAGVDLVSCSEHVDNTPAGKFSRTIMAAQAAFYSDNLALEVIKGATQKAKTGGTIGKAPLGYRNVRQIENGREVRTVDIDPVRGPLMKWAFEAYATGDWTLRPLLSELTRRGLTSPGTRKVPEKPLEVSHLHKLLRHPYYKGIVRYRGVEYAGSHQPLIDETTWERVQQLLAAKDHSGERQRTHPHYLKGSLFCGSCGSRLIVSKNKNRYGTVYSYFVCLGRHQKRTTCTSRYVAIEAVEQAVIDLYGSVELAPHERDAIALRVGLDFETFRREIEVERSALEKRQRRLLRERERVLQAHYADAVPLDLLRNEQKRIATELTDIAARLDVTDRHEAIINFNLERTLRLATNVGAVYEESDPKERRLLNQAFFNRILVFDGSSVTAELAEPYDLLLNPTLRARAAGLLIGDGTGKNPRTRAPKQNEPRQALGCRGSNSDTLVGAGGFEPP